MDARKQFDTRLLQLHVCSDLAPSGAARELANLRDDFERLAEPLRRELLGSTLAWNDADRSQARWLHRTSDDLAVMGYRLCRAIQRHEGLPSDDAQAMGLLSLFYMGETVKWEVAVAPRAARDYRKPHRLMRDAIAAGRHRLPLTMEVDGVPSQCTVESLYFRVLVLARFASGALNIRQIEILDALMWTWMPVLQGVDTAPEGAALRADLDSAEGLKRGPRPDEGPSLYLPQGPIEQAYRAVIAELHAGNLVPSTGRCAQLRIEEHVAVLDLVHCGMLTSRRPPVIRAVRRAGGGEVELWLGLGEIDSRALLASPPAAAHVTLVADATSAAKARRESDRHITADSVYERTGRFVRLLDTSETGLGLDGAHDDCANIAAGDLVAVRGVDEPLVIGKVVRCVPSKSPGRVVIGVRKFAATAKHLSLAREGGAPQLLLFVPGSEPCGRHDAFLVSERAFTEGGTFSCVLDGIEFRLRFNRARLRGRGWVLAGIEIIGAQRARQAA